MEHEGLVETKKYDMIDAIQQRVNLIPDSAGLIRCKLVVAIAAMLEALKDSLKQEDEEVQKKILILEERLNAAEVCKEIKMEEGN